MKIAVTGRHGQLARALVESAAADKNVKLVAIGRPELDLVATDTIATALSSIRPDVVVNAAAYTAVDSAEDEPELARLVNAVAAGELARAAQELGARIIQISTDYVFSGSKPKPYLESDAPGPLGVYGRTKLEGEERVRAQATDHVILRTAWVYSPFGRNFVKTMLTLASRHDEISVVADQFGNPTSALDLAGAVLRVARDWVSNDAGVNGRTFHVAGRGDCSWADFAEEIYRQSGALGGPIAAVRRIKTSEYPAAAPRPGNSRLDAGAFEQTFAYCMRDWRESLLPVVRRSLMQGSR